MDGRRTSSRIALSNNGQTLSRVGPRRGDAQAIGRKPLIRGTHSLRVKTSSLPDHAIGLGITTLPLVSTYDGFSFATVYAWFSNQMAIGQAASQTRRSARMSIWEQGDILQLTLNCEQRKLHLYHQRTRERKTIKLQARQGTEFFWYFYMNGRGQKVDILK